VEGDGLFAMKEEGEFGYDFYTNFKSTVILFYLDDSMHDYGIGDLFSGN